MVLQSGHPPLKRVSAQGNEFQARLHSEMLVKKKKTKILKTGTTEHDIKGGRVVSLCVALAPI